MFFHHLEKFYKILKSLIDAIMDSFANLANQNRISELYIFRISKFYVCINRKWVEIELQILNVTSKQSEL